MSVEKIDQIYPLAAFLIDCLGQDITKEKMKDLFSYLNIRFEPKIAELFCLSKERVEEVYDSITNAPVTTTTVQSTVSEDEPEEEKPKQEAAPADDFDVFGDEGLFG